MLKELGVDKARLGIAEQGLIVGKKRLVEVVVQLEPPQSPVDVDCGLGIASVTSDALFLASKEAKQAIIVAVELVDSVDFTLNMSPLGEANLLGRPGLFRSDS